ncbi:MAG: NAD-dependent epimerase/dehydratase family protein, partial [Acidimicrobiales bacterium]|nr:NAD-dependent epimerase/dehydratase family protein [Acidimicrobiales bacterium]
MTDFWRDRRVLVTGGSGFLGQAVVARLQAAGAGHVVVPRSAEHDLRDRAQAAALFAEARPDLVIHLAAKVGGIGYNQVHPAELYLDNLLMGTYVVE